MKRTQTDDDSEQTVLMMKSMTAITKELVAIKTI